MARRLATTKLSSKGQIVVPEEFRKKMGLETGTEFIVISEGDALIFKTIAPPPKKDITQLLAKVKKQVKESGLTKEALELFIKDERKKSRKSKAKK